jgi:multidrug transporter EmrE-like cation transporter
MHISRKTVLLVLIIILFFLAHNKVIEIYNEIIVNNFFKHIEGNVQSLIWTNILIVCTLIYFYYFSKEKKKIPIEIVFIAGFLLLIYLGYRFNSYYFQFHRSSILPNFVFADYFIFLFGGIIILKLIELTWKEDEAIYFDDPFLWDAPIDNASDDKFHRKETAERLARKIQSKLTNDTGKGSLAIGVNGEWGSGKTSFANMIK